MYWNLLQGTSDDYPLDTTTNTTLFLQRNLDTEFFSAHAFPFTSIVLKWWQRLDISKSLRKLNVTGWLNTIKAKLEYMFLFSAIWLDISFFFFIWVNGHFRHHWWILHFMAQLCFGKTRRWKNWLVNTLAVVVSHKRVTPTESSNIFRCCERFR